MKVIDRLPIREALDALEGHLSSVREREPEAVRSILAEIVRLERSLDEADLADRAKWACRPLPSIRA
jgi:hypothetical protein